ncbi:MAG: Zn-ribbon domain-containing OB-fold protein [Candidatus Abyssobacteria bacterium SURF_5]|uniref:Zn-ribbon domain-containing OB-fold protein n=1 Tax=Abyssobacteria bacterium (strain SURF_5) TaxID=2093360 RepID=A0A3A4N494_ABYX5|nr:MAG: Zn-ribbon domain-containing OB-fold protein [Candidatus Abyssubacteria bacterium SURF_5]
MSEYAKPLPDITESTKPFWEGCKAGKLLLPKCRSCGQMFFFPNHFCPECLSEDVDWIDSSGKGVVHTFTIISRPPSDAFAADVPYVVAVIDLEEGPRMLSNVIGIPPEHVRVGMPVEVVFERVSEEITLPKFRPFDRV